MEPEPPAAGAARPAGIMLLSTEEGTGLRSEEQTEGRSPCPRQRSAVFLAGLTAAVLLVAALAACATVLGRGGTARRSGGAAGTGTSSLWAPTFPDEGAGCEVTAFEFAQFGGASLSLSTGTLDLPFPVGSLQVAGDCTAFLMGRSEDSSTTIWPCFFAPGAYEGNVSLGRWCPNLAWVRTVGAQRGVIREVDAFKYRWDDESLRLNDSAVCSRDIPRTTNWTRQTRQRAMEWFHKNFNMYIINMDRCPDRWARMVQQFADLKLRNYIRVQGPDVRAPGVMARFKASGDVLNPAFEVGNFAGTVGSILGHMAAWHAGADADKPYAIVFEDDAVLDTEFVEELWDLLHTRAPADWEILSLYNMVGAYGHCVGPGMLRAPELPAPYWCATTLGIYWYGWGLQAVMYRREVLPRVIDLIGARSFAGTGYNYSCNGADNILYGAAGIFKFYLLFNHTPVSMDRAAPSVRTQLGGDRRLLL